MKSALFVLALAGCLSPKQRTAALATASTALLAADWYQTRTFITPKCWELNPVIGPCGDRVPPDIYFPLVILGHLGLAAVLGSWRDVFLGGLAGAQGATVWTNSASL